MDSNLIRVKKEAPELVDEQPQNRMAQKKAAKGVEEKKKIKVELKEESVEMKPTIPSQNGPSQGAQQCRCLIDLSSPASLERDFYAWLNGVEPISDSPRQCLFSRPHSPPPPAFAPLLPMMMPSDRLQMLSLAECPHLVPHIGHPHFVELPAFLMAPSECSSSASSSFSSSASASSSSISPGGTAHCCSFAASSTESGIGGEHRIHAERQHFKRESLQSIAPISAFAASNDGGKLPAPPQPMRMRRKRNVDKASGRGTNLYGRTYCPGRPLSMEERAQIIHLFHGGMKVNAISKQLCISHGCVSKIITRFRETGNLMPSSHSECRRRKRLLLQQQQQQQIQQIQHNHDLALGEQRIG